MAESKVVIVHLRRPKMKKPGEKRSDPFFEFGSFGCTTCHSRNLLNPKRDAEVEGLRLAFAQGGSRGFRLVFLTPPITVKRWKDCLEARWEPHDMPFRYEDAPVLAWNRGGQSDFRGVKRMLRSTRRSTLEARFCSCFRTRARPLDPALSREIVRIYEKKRAAAKEDSIATYYWEALPDSPPCKDINRRQTYKEKLAERQAILDKKPGSTRRRAGACCHSKCK
jgi:hypothetical protein